MVQSVKATQAEMLANCQTSRLWRVGDVVVAALRRQLRKARGHLADGRFLYL